MVALNYIVELTVLKKNDNIYFITTMVSKTIWLKYIINKFKGGVQGLFVFDNWMKLYG